MATENVKKPRKEFTGTVRSTAMDKSIVVEIVTPRPDRLYRKYVKSTKRVMAHDAKNAAGIGDRVRVVECRPLSKRKCWRLVEIIEKARGTGSGVAVAPAPSQARLSMAPATLPRSDRSEAGELK